MYLYADVPMTVVLVSDTSVEYISIMLTNLLI